MCDHATIHEFDESAYWGSDALNQNWDHAVCLACGIIGSLCGACSSFWPVHTSDGAFYGRPYHHNGVERCSMCLRCVRCCPNLNRELPLTSLDIREAVLRFIRATRHHYLKDAKGNAVGGHANMDATRYSVEERVCGFATEGEAVRWLLNDPHGTGGGRRGDWIEWRPRGAERFENGRKLKGKDPAGLFVDFDHRRGTIDPITLVRAIRALPRRTYVCLGCGGEFTSAIAECPFWRHQEATQSRHGLDHDSFHESPFRGRVGRLLIVQNESAPAALPVEPLAGRADDDNRRTAQLALY